jgi:hypothetical protein
MTRARPITMVVLIDALGWSYLEGHPFLSGLLPYRRSLRTVLGFSSGAIPTILTGLPPASTGHWNLLYYDPAGSPFRWIRCARYLPKWILDHRITRRIVTEIGRRLLGMGPGFECCISPELLPWFNWVERKNIYDRGGITGAPSIFDQLDKEGIEFRVYSYHESSDTEILERAESDLERSDATFFFVYLCEMDMFLHLHCQEPSKVAEKLGWYEKSLQKLFSVVRKIDPNARLIVTSDHGMTPVVNHYDLIGVLEPLGLRMPEDLLAVFDSTMARFWFFNDRTRETVSSALRDLTCGRWLTDEELKRSGVFFADRRFGEQIYLLHPGWLLSRSDFNGAGWMPSGMHGYQPDDCYSDAIFLASHQPGFAMETIADVHRCMKEAIQRSVSQKSEDLIGATSRSQS